MKALKIIGIVVGVLVLAAGIFYVGWMRAPSPSEVCANIGKVLGKEGVPASPALLASCEANLQEPAYGKLKYVKQMKCLRDADSKAELKQCGRGF